MRNIMSIFFKEFRSYFVSPIAYVCLTVFLLLTGYLFYIGLSNFERACLRAMQWAQFYGRSAQPMNINDQMIRSFLNTTCFISLFIVPMITMRLFSEEKKIGTIELLLTSPLSNLQIVLGKFFASFALYVLMVSITLLYQLLLIIYGHPDVLSILSGYLGLYLLGGAFIALGLLVSSLTENQVVAGFISFGLFLLLWVISLAESFVGPGFGNFLKYLSIIEHFDDFAKGILDTKDVIYYLSCIFLGLFLTERSLESLRWRH